MSNSVLIIKNKNLFDDLGKVTSKDDGPAGIRTPVLPLARRASYRWTTGP